MSYHKTSVRQRMINLMYLVFIAMLAINLSPEVLSAFGFLKDDLEAYNKATEQKNKNLYSNLDSKVSDQYEKYRPLQIKLNKVKEISSDYYKFLEALKDTLFSTVQDSTNFELMNSSIFLDDYFFRSEEYSAKGKEFVEKMNTFQMNLTTVLGEENSALSAVIEKRFSAEDQVNLENKQIKWLVYHYKGFPLIASITNITQLQTKIKNTESDILNALLGRKLDNEVSLKNYNGIVRLDKSAYFSGENVTGQVVLGRYDSTLVPNKVLLNDIDITNSVKDGQVIINMPAGNVGNHDIKGVISFVQDGVPTDVSFNSVYSVITQPTEAVISADKMNVVYRGLENPVSVSLPGVADKDIIVSAKGLQKVGTGKYIISPGNEKQLSVNVSAILSSGKKVTSSKLFRVLDVPEATTMIRGESGLIGLPKSSVLGLRIDAGLPNFVFDLSLEVTSFKMKVTGQLAILVSGNKMDERAKSLIRRAKKGDVINIFEVKGRILGKSSYELKKVSPISVEIIN